MAEFTGWSPAPGTSHTSSSSAATPTAPCKLQRFANDGFDRPALPTLYVVAEIVRASPCRAPSPSRATPLTAEVPATPTFVGQRSAAASSVDSPEFLRSKLKIGLSQQLLIYMFCLFGAPYRRRVHSLTIRCTTVHHLRFRAMLLQIYIKKVRCTTVHQSVLSCANRTFTFSPKVLADVK